MCVKVCYGFWMAKIPLRGVTYFTDIHFSLASFTTYSVKVPDRTNRRESCQELGYTFVLGIPMAYPNTTKQLVPLCYPLPASVKVVDDKLDFSPAGLGFRRRGGPERPDATNS